MANEVLQGSGNAMNPDEMTVQDNHDNSHWSLDKRVPLALILALCVQTAGIAWWASQTSERLSNLERRVEMASPQGDRLTRVEVKLDNIASAIADIKQSVRGK